MAVNETIVTGRYFRRCTDAANKVWQRISFWHKASDCEFDDNKNAQTKVGAIKGITTSTSVTETGYAADMTTVKNLQTQIDELNSNLGDDELLTFYGTSFKTPNYKTKITIRAYMIFQSTSQGGSRKYTVNTPTGNHSWTLSSSSDTDTKQQQFTETIECPPNTTISISSAYASGATNCWINTFFIWGAGIKIS